jgi:hypothetical protein
MRVIFGKSFGVGFSISWVWILVIPSWGFDLRRPTDYVFPAASFLAGSTFVWRQSGKNDGLTLALVDISLFSVLIALWFVAYIFFIGPSQLQG